MSNVEKKDPYGVLEISRDATEDEIKAAYKRMARRWHPDRHVSGKEVAGQKFIEGHDAYRTLMAKQIRRRSKASSKAPKRNAPEKASSERSDSGNLNLNADIDAGPSPLHSGSTAPHASPTHTPVDKQLPPSGSQHVPLDGDNSDSSSTSGSSSRCTSSSKRGSAKPPADNSSPRSKNVDAHSTPSSPGPLYQSVASHAGDQSPRISGVNQASAKPTADNASPRSKNADVHSMRSSPGPMYQSVSLHADDKSPRISGVNQTSVKPMVDNVSPRPKTPDAPSIHSSPESEHRSVLSHASDAHPWDIPTFPEATSPDSPKSPSQKFRARLRRKRKSNPEPAPDPDLEDHVDDYIHISQSKGIPTEPNGHGEGDNAVADDRKFEPALRPLNSPLSSPKEWQFPLQLTLEELFHGTTIRFRVTRRLLTGKTKQCLVVIDIPQGTYAGTKIRCPGIGHERKNGTRQDVVFIVAEKPHDRFQRVEDDLFLDVLVPYVDQLAEQGGDISVKGIDRAMLTVNIPYPIEQNSTDGKVIVKGAGMPFCDGRGDLIVKWQVVFPSPISKWDSLKKTLHMEQ